MTEAQLTIEHWRDDYNTQHPHGSLGRRTPSEFAAQWKEVTPVLTSKLDQKWGALHTQFPLFSAMSVEDCAPTCDGT